MNRAPQSLDDLIARYARGDLDRVELEELEERASREPQLRLQLDHAHDRRTSSMGFLSYVGSADLSECFSIGTLERFAKDDLAPSQRDMVQGHLSCPLCSAQVQGLRKSTGSRRVRWSRRNALVVTTGLLAAGLVLAAILLRRPSDALNAYFASTSRTYEGRLSFAALPYAPYDAHLSRAPKATALPLKLLASLEANGQRRAMAAVYLRTGRPSEAVDLLKGDRTPQARSDRAAALLALGRNEEALREADAAKNAAPELEAAQWNLALALERMGLEAAAAQGFKALATDSTQHWAQNAVRRSQRLELKVKGARSRYEDAKRKAKSWVLSDASPDLEIAQTYPDLARKYFYQALAASPDSKTQVRLRPLSKALSNLFQDRALPEWLGRSQKSTATRTRLSIQLQDALREKPAKEKLEALLKEAEEASLPLLALSFARLLRVQRQKAGALLRTLPVNDPWLSATLMTWKGRSAERPIPALQVAVEAAVSDAQRAEARVRLGEAYIREGDLGAAQKQGKEALALAIRSADWTVTNRALLLRGSVAFQALSATEALAYFQEVRARLPGKCAYQRYAVERIAQLWLYNRAPERSLEALRGLGACREKLSPLGALALSDSLRGVDATTDEREWLRTEIQRAVDSPGSRGLVGRYVQARDTLPKDPKRGTAQLEAFIRDSASVAQAHLSVRESRIRAFGLLALHEAQRKDFVAALKHLASEANLPAPKACALGALLDDDRRVVVALDRHGKALGMVDPNWRVPIGELSAEKIVPERFQTALRDCATVDVLALPPLWGAPKLLGGDLAWRYRKAPQQPIDRASMDTLKHLVVANPHGLVQAGWPALPEYRNRNPQSTQLIGASATVPNVLAALPHASTVEFFTHGRFDSTGQLTDLVLTPGPRQSYLNAKALLSIELSGAPTIYLGACFAGATPPSARRSTTLIEAFLLKGAAGIVASNQEIGASDWQGFIARVQNAQRAGVSLARAVQRAKSQTQENASGWLSSVLVFSP